MKKNDSTPFITDDFLLTNDVARELYHEYAAREPIFDYHCHLPPDQIATNKTFRNLYEIWLAGDHYKWRAMRANGVPEKFCTGNASDYAKFLAYARTVPNLLRNPLYHWTHLELKKFFGITELLDESTAKKIWDTANAQLANMPVSEILHRSRVTVICTTDDPTDTLEHHRAIRRNRKLKTRVYPTWRPDKALAIDQPAIFNPWVDKLSEASGIECNNLANFLAALERRHEFFHENGCRLSDHGLPHCFAEDCCESEAARIFDDARAGRAITRLDADRYRTFMMLFFGELDAIRGWTKQLHLGALRNTNTRCFRTLGPDTGFDTIGDWPQASALAWYLDKLEQRNRLPKIILYNLNPADNYVFAAMIGNFQNGSIPGKIQYGSGWWFLDQKEGMEWQLNALSNLGLLSRFVGMLTDSRSFLSYSRHEYFRRILCNLIGRDVLNGELPQDMKLLGQLVRNICYHNAKNYFGLEPGKLD
ncbi:MAG: glucuronate isomerase [Verrucomicrobiae bacterium]|nr:glucuronate isomerase [Verrucomicrobiae bacterium]